MVNIFKLLKVKKTITNPYLLPFGEGYMAQDTDGNIIHSEDGITWTEIKEVEK